MLVPLVAAMLAACRAPGAPAGAPEANPQATENVDIPTSSAHSQRPVVLPVVMPPRHITVDAATPLRPDSAARVAPTVTEGAGFLGRDDEQTLSRLCNAPIERIERNRGGSTVSFRVWFAGGERGLFKPQQRSEVANYRAELAAYRMSRLLGLGRTPPACGRQVPRAMLQRVADASGDAAFSQRVMTELLGRGEQVPGAMLYWVPGQLEPVPDVARYPQLLGDGALAPGDAALAADLSALLIFDYLNDNVDRWSGGNILRPRRTGDTPTPMLFMDNGASFSALHEGLGARPEEQAARIARVSHFPRALIARVRALTLDGLRAAMGADPLGACLSDAQLGAVLLRRDRLIARVDAAIAAQSAEAVLSFP